MTVGLLRVRDIKSYVYIKKNSGGGQLAITFVTGRCYKNFEATKSAKCSKFVAPMKNISNAKDFVK